MSETSARGIKAETPRQTKHFDGRVGHHTARTAPPTYTPAAELMTTPLPTPVADTTSERAIIASAPAVPKPRSQAAAGHCASRLITSAASTTTPSMSCAASSLSAPPPKSINDACGVVTESLSLFTECVPWWDARAEALKELVSIQTLPYTRVTACFLAFPADHDARWEPVTQAERDQAQDALGPQPQLPSSPRRADRVGHEVEDGRDLVSDRRVFLGQLHRRHTVGLLRWLFHEILMIPRASVIRIEAHQDARTGRGKGCAWVTLAPRADAALEDHLISLHHHLLFDVHKGVDGVWLVRPADGAVLQKELEIRSVSERAPVELSRRLPRGALVVERPRSRRVIPAKPTTVDPTTVTRRRQKGLHPLAPTAKGTMALANTSLPPSHTSTPREEDVNAARGASVPVYDPAARSPSPPPPLPAFRRADYGDTSLDGLLPRYSAAVRALSRSAGTSTPPPPPPYFAGFVAQQDRAIHTRLARQRRSEDRMAVRNFCESYMPSGDDSCASALTNVECETPVVNAVVSESEMHADAVRVAQSSALSPCKVLNSSGTSYRFNPYITICVDGEEPGHSPFQDYLHRYSPQDPFFTTTVTGPSHVLSADGEASLRRRGAENAAEMVRAGDGMQLTYDVVVPRTTSNSLACVPTATNMSAPRGCTWVVNRSSRYGSSV